MIITTIHSCTMPWLYFLIKLFSLELKNGFKNWCLFFCVSITDSFPTYSNVPVGSFFLLAALCGMWNFLSRDQTWAPCSQKSSSWFIFIRDVPSGVLCVPVPVCPGCPLDWLYSCCPGVSSFQRKSLWGNSWGFL